MKNTNKIYFSDNYQSLLKELKDLEKDRIFCKHDIEHFKDVARICYILALESGLDIKKDLIYTTALLHDIGRVEEYKNGVDHNLASVKIGKELLELTDFNSEEKSLILSAIDNHRKGSEEEPFYEIFYKADKLSRFCLNCPSKDECYWSDEMKNLEIKY